MSRMIDADAIPYTMIYKENWLEGTGCEKQGVWKSDIDAMPTIEERKTGKWIKFDYPWYQCSECGAVRENKSFLENFCPNCGADMRGEEHETTL